MFESWILSDRLVKDLAKRHKDFPNATAQNKKRCVKCANCCWQRPCSLSTNDVEKISKFLKISKEKLFETKLCVDKISDKFVLLPIRHEQKNCAGGFLDWRRTYDHRTPCIFNNEETRLCEIHKVKPEGGKKMSCFKEESKNAVLVEWTKEDLMKLGWDGCEYDEDYD